MTFLNFWVISVFAVYFAILIGIAVVRSRQMREMQDYVLGGRRLSAATSALSASSSAVSSGSMLVVPALAFVDGGMTLWLAGSVLLGAVLSWMVLARRLRRYTFAAENSLTISEFLEKRFDDRTGTLRSLVAVVTLFFVIIYISSGLVGGSKLLEETFGLEHNVGIVVTLSRGGVVHAGGWIPGGVPHRRIPVADHVGFFRHHSRHAAARDGQSGDGDAVRSVGVPEPVQRCERRRAVLGLRGVAAGLGGVGLGVATGAAEVHGDRGRDPDSGEPQHRRRLAVPHNRVRVGHRLGSPSGAGAGGDAGSGGGGP